MLTSQDVISGKIAVQLGLVAPDEVRGHLRQLDAAPTERKDLINVLTESGRLDDANLALLRHRSALYDHVRREAIYMRLLEKETTIQKESVAKLLAQLERAAFRRRLGEVLVQRGNLQADYDRGLLEKQQRLIDKEEARILARYRDEDFEGVARPLIPGSNLAPENFKISTLFRSKETRALVGKAELALLRAEAAARQEAEGDKTLILADPLQAPQGQAQRPQQAPAGVDPLADTTKLPPGTVQLPDPIPDRAGPGSPGAAAAGAEPAAAATSLTIEQVKNLKRIADYTVVEVLGVGGMGAVFLGQKDGAGELVAIKVLLNQAASPEEKGRFEREMTLAMRVQHKNVLSIIDTGQTEEGLTFVCVPALAGKELRDLLKHSSEQGFAPQLACHLFEQVLHGLQAVHDAGIVHRDMKPENVFVLAGGMQEIRIMDFGLAKPDEENAAAIDVFRTLSGEISGSPAYIAPETVSSDPIDGRTDIYSLGVMFFEMLTGKLPLESESTQGYLTQHLICPPLTLAEASPKIEWPEPLEDLLARMLA